MLNSYPRVHRSYRWGMGRSGRSGDWGIGGELVAGALVAFASVFGAAGCQGVPLSPMGGEVVSCPAVLTCPPTEPIDGTPCAGTVPAGGCEYGVDPQYFCGTIALCDPTRGWVTQIGLGSPTCPTSLSFSCPPSFDEAQATSSQLACASLPTNLTCTYPEGRCDCEQGLSVLTCTAPAPAGCPATRPRAGTPCSTAVGSCSAWGTGICDGQSMTCTCGLWRPLLCYD